MTLGRIWAATAVAAFLLGAAFGLTSAASATEAQWQDFRAPDAGFAILMPGKPELSTEKTAKGIVSILQGVDLGDTYWAVSHSDLQNNLSPDELLNGARDGAIAASKGVMRSQRKLDEGNIPALDVIYDSPTEKLTVEQRFYINRKQLYQAVYVGPVNSETAPEVVRFFDSFRFIGD